MDTSASTIQHSLLLDFRARLNDDNRRLLNRRTFSHIAPVAQFVPSEDSHLSTIVPAVSDWVDKCIDQDNLGYCCVAFFPVRVPHASASAAMDTPLAPLLWYSVDAFDGANNQLQLNTSTVRINVGLLSDLGGLPPDATQFEQLTNRLSTDVLNAKTLKWLLQKLNEIAPDVDWGCLTRPLETTDWVSMLNHAPSYDTPECYPYAFVGLIQPTSTQEQLRNEVEQSVLNCTSLSALHALFQTKTVPLTGSETPLAWYSPRLSTEQASTLELMRERQITAVVGPHGSGKTSTLVAAALAEVANGKTVLISAPSTASLDQLADGVRKASDNSVPFIRSCGGGELRLLLNRVKAILDDQTPLENIVERDVMSRRALTKTLDALSVETNKFMGHFKATNKKPGRFNELVQRLLNPTIHEPAINDFQTKILKLEHQTDLAYTRSLKASIERRGREAAETCRDHLLNFVQSESTQDIHLNGLDLAPEVWSALFAMIPIWIIDAQAMARLLPFSEGIFDVGLIDDAHRMDSAVSWPILFRVQSALLAANQISRLALEKDTLPTTLWTLYQRLVNTHNAHPMGVLGMNYRVNNGRTLISQSNSLTTDSDNLQSPGTVNLGLHWHSLMIDSRTDSPVDRETQTAVEWVKSYHSAHRHHRLPKTIGIISPSRSQVQRLTELAQERLPIHLFPRHALVIGLPEHFDGRDKDIMLV
ncbi:MAG: AAA family ATPase, partial [Bradymonadia bacterium]